MCSSDLYLVDIIRDKLAVEARTNLAIEICKKRNLHKLHYETTGFQDTDKYIIEKKCRESGYWIEVVEISASVASKEDRIRGLQPLYERGDIRWPEKYQYYSQFDHKRHDMIEELRDEMLMFPKCEHDDLLDCHSQFLQVGEFTPTKKVASEPEDMFMKARQLAIDAKTAQKPKHTHSSRSPKTLGQIQFRRSLW